MFHDKCDHHAVANVTRGIFPYHLAVVSQMDRENSINVTSDMLLSKELPSLPSDTHTENLPSFFISYLVFLFCFVFFSGTARGCREL